MKLLLLSAAFASLSFVAKDCFLHIRYTKQLIPDCEEKLAHFEEISAKNYSYPVSYLYKQGSANAEKRELLAPVLRDYINND